MRRWSGVKLTALTIALSVIISACPMVRASSSESDFWTYEVHTSFSDISVTGFMTYRVQGGYTFSTQDVSDVGVDVLAVAGYFEGNTSVSGLNRSVTVSFSGYRHEVRGNDAILTDDSRTLVRLSEGYDTVQVTSSIEVWELTSYSPPLMDGIDTGELMVGDSWTQTTTSTTSVWVYEGFNTSFTDDVSTVSVDYAVISSGTESTVAGDFQATEVQQSIGSVTESYWYSEEVGRFIRYERTEAGLEEPVFVAVLADYRYDRSSWLADMITPLFGLLVASLVFMAIAVVLALSRRRPEGREKGEMASEDASVDKPKDEGDDSDRGSMGE